MDLDLLYNLYALDLWPDGDNEPAAPIEPSCQHLLRTGPETGWCRTGQGVVCVYDTCPDWQG